MFTAIHNALTNSLSNVEAFGKTSFRLLPFILAIVISQVLVLLIGKWLWNDFLSKYITVIKPVDSIWDLLAISIIITLLFK